MNEDLLTDAMNNVAQAHSQAAQVDQQKMAVAGQIGHEIIGEAGSINKMIAQHEYYKNVDTANNIIGGISNASLNASSAYSESPDLNSATTNNTHFTNMLAGASKQVDKLNLPDAIKERINNKISYYQTVNQQNYNKRVGHITAGTQYDNFSNVVTSLSSSAGTNMPDVSDLATSAQELLKNPYLSASQKTHVYNTLSNIKQLHSAVDTNTAFSTNNAEHTNIALDNTVSNRSMDNTIKGLFLERKSFLSANNINLLTTKPDKFAELRTRYSDMQHMYKYLSNSMHLTHDLSELQNSDDLLHRRVANVIMPMIDKGLGAQVVRGMNPTVDAAYKNYNSEVQAASSDPANKVSQKVAAAYQDYTDKLQVAADHLGLPMSKVGTLPQNLITQMTEINKDYNNPEYQPTLNSVLNKYTEIMGDHQPVYGMGDLSNTVRLYKYGDQSNPDMPSFIANSNHNRQAEISKEFGQKGYDKKFLTAYIQDNDKSIDTLSSMIDIPLSKANELVTSQLMHYRNLGLDESEASAKVNGLLAGYASSKSMDIGDNYLLKKGTLSNMGIHPEDADNTISRAIQLSLHKVITDPTHKPKNIPQAAWEIRRNSTFGVADDYSMISSNGRYYAKNNITGNLLPIAKNMFTLANHKIQKEKEPNKQREKAKKIISSSLSAMSMDPTSNMSGLF